MTEKIVVSDSVEGKYGSQLKDKDGFLSFGKFYRGEKTFPKGTVLEVDLFISDKGNRYINSAKVVGETAEEKAPKKTKIKEPPVAAMQSTPEYKPRDYDKENRGKVKSLFIEALLSNPNVVNTDTRDLLLEQLKGLNHKAVQDELNKLVESVF